VICTPVTISYSVPLISRKPVIASRIGVGGFRSRRRELLRDVERALQPDEVERHLAVAARRNVDLHLIQLQIGPQLGLNDVRVEVFDGVDVVGVPSHRHERLLAEHGCGHRVT
jgi:hypothetical protein